MKSLLEIISYAQKFDTHLVGVKILEGSEPQSGMIYSELETNTKWRVYGGGTLPIEAHSKGHRAITLIRDHGTGILKVGVKLIEI